MEEKPRTTPYPLRMPEDLREALEASAREGSRSLHAEIIARLEASVRPTSEMTLGLLAMGIGGYSPKSEMARAAGQINDLQGKRNTLAILANALHGNDASEELAQIKEEMRALDAQIASLVQIIRARAPNA